jgi:hypothetical protein
MGPLFTCMVASVRTAFASFQLFGDLLFPRAAARHCFDPLHRCNLLAARCADSRFLWGSVPRFVSFADIIHRFGRTWPSVNLVGAVLTHMHSELRFGHIVFSNWTEAAKLDTLILLRSVLVCSEITTDLASWPFAFYIKPTPIRTAMIG